MKFNQITALKNEGFFLSNVGHPYIDIKKINGVRCIYLEICQMIDSVDLFLGCERIVVIRGNLSKMQETLNSFFFYLYSSFVV